MTILINKTERKINFVTGDVQNVTHFLGYMHKCVLLHLRNEIKLPNAKLVGSGIFWYVPLNGSMTLMKDVVEK